jgi:hypothetical protein
MEGMGETGQDVSNVAQAFSDKTATEVKDMALLRSARDNANKLMLSQALSKMTYLWFKMSQQFIDGHKLIRITGKDALKYLVDEGMNGWTMKHEGFEAVSQVAQEMKINFDANKKYFEKHKKTPEYDYKANGYNFLGWQNGWVHVHYDEDGNITSGDTSKGEKPKKSFGYDSSKHPEYASCVKEKHQLIEVQHNRRGSENTVSCPICMIYWKYDCSD